MSEQGLATGVAAQRIADDLCAGLSSLDDNLPRSESFGMGLAKFAPQLSEFGIRRPRCRFWHNFADAVPDWGMFAETCEVGRCGTKHDQIWQKTTRSLRLSSADIKTTPEFATVPDNV